MNSNKYYAGIIIRVILIVISAVLLSFLTFRTNYLYSIFVLILLIIAETYGLIRYILRRRDEIKRMLEYIKENNPSLYFSRSREYPFNELGYFLNEIGEIVREVRIEKENQLQYMNFIVQNAGTGLLSFDREGNVDIFNQAARELLGIAELNSISALEKIHRGLPEILNNLKSREQRVITLKSERRLQQLAVRSSIFKMGQKEIRLVSFQDIKNELDEKEMDSWQKLIRILTHEIINSVTPVTSLTSTISGFFRNGDKVMAARDLPDENIREALTGLGYIEDRGKNLINFVSKFRSLTRLPAPRFEEVSLKMLTEKIAAFKKDELLANRIELKCSVSPGDLSLYCDSSLVEHVLLNLVNNASDAIMNKSDGTAGTIEIQGVHNDDHRAVINVLDNGTGIPDDLLESVFIPFFTTKEHGSGIGLSLSRQIMKLHGGTISVSSGPGTGTVFSLIF